MIERRRPSPSPPLIAFPRPSSGGRGRPQRLPAAPRRSGRVVGRRPHARFDSLRPQQQRPRPAPASAASLLPLVLLCSGASVAFAASFQPPPPPLVPGASVLLSSSRPTAAASAAAWRGGARSGGGTLLCDDGIRIIRTGPNDANNLFGASPSPLRSSPRLDDLDLAAVGTDDDGDGGGFASGGVAAAAERRPIPWYSDPDLGGGFGGSLSSPDDVEHAASSHAARFVLFHGRGGVYHVVAGEGGEEEGGEEKVVEPLFLRYSELEDVLGAAMLGELVAGRVGQTPAEAGFVLAWVGERDGLDYWAVRMPEEDSDVERGMWRGRLERLLVRRERRAGPAPGGPSDDADAEQAAAKKKVVRPAKKKVVRLAPVREFGDNLSVRSHAAVLATANGLVEFHSTHLHCNRCGSTTRSVRAGSSRRCTGPKCGAGIYPRIEPAAIVLVTSPCGQYALLGRKKSWPRGRYSTLAGFAEIGETLEGCCVREVREEAGVDVDPNSVEFVTSQPWPFPRSLMVGFTARAVAVVGEGEEGGTTGTVINGDERDGDGTPLLPTPVVDPDELEDVRWFHRDYVADRIVSGDGGSTALTYVPKGNEAEFHIPGRASLARLLISTWAMQGR